MRKPGLERTAFPQYALGHDVRKVLMPDQFKCCAKRDKRAFSLIRRSLSRTRKSFLPQKRFIVTLRRAEREQLEETAKDWAEETARLLDTDFPKAEKVVLVCDNLNTRTIASFYESVSAEPTRNDMKRLEIQDTPKHGSWFGAAEIELSIVTDNALTVAFRTSKPFAEKLLRGNADATLPAKALVGNSPPPKRG